MKKVTKVIIILIVSLFVLGVIGTGFMFRNEIMIARSIEKIDDENRVYMMDFKDGYHLDALMETGISSDQELANVLTGYISHGFYKAPEAPEQHIGCSTLTALSEDGHMIWGRNFDWYDGVTIIVRSTPKDGYASLATCEFSNITGNPETVPEGIGNSFLAVAAYYVPMDGINEKGLCVANLEVNEGGQEIVDTERTNITVTMAIRLLLDRAATVDEAIELLNQYDICPSGGISAHLSISDSSGRAVVAEFMDGKVEIVETPVVTNFNLKNGDPAAGGESAMRRYYILTDTYSKASGILSREEVAAAMQSVAQTEGTWHTLWTLVYENSDAPSVSYYWKGEFDKEFHVALSDCFKR